MDEILIYDAIKFQRVVPARAKFVRFIRSQFESFSLTVKPLGGKRRGEGQKPRVGREKEKVGRTRSGTAEESVGTRRGNIVLNRKIGILINTRGLSIKEGDEGNEHVKGWEEGRMAER